MIHSSSKPSCRCWRGSCEVVHTFMNAPNEEIYLGSIVFPSSFDPIDPLFGLGLEDILGALGGHYRFLQGPELIRVQSCFDGSCRNSIVYALISLSLPPATRIPGWVVVVAKAAKPQRPTFMDGRGILRGIPSLPSNINNNSTEVDASSVLVATRPGFGRS